MNIFTKRSLQALVAGSALIGSFALTGTAFAAPVPTSGFGHGGMNMPRPAVVGTVASISGNTLTVTAKAWQRGSSTTTATTYSVDATNATVTKSGASSTVSAIAVGDMIFVQGTVSGTSVTATKIYDGLMGRMGMPGKKPDMNVASHTPAIIGNGQPVIGGSVTAISGNSLTVTNKSNVTYTVDVTSATVTKTGVTGATISNIVVGDNVVIQGAVNGTSIIASSVIDQVAPSSTSNGTKRPMGGFFGAIGGFFSHLFGFF